MCACRRSRDAGRTWIICVIKVLKYPVSGTRFSMLDWVRVTGLSCTKGVWYMYDWDTRSSILS